MVPPREPDHQPAALPAFNRVVADLLLSGQSVVFRADGVSMRPALKPGDLLRVEPLADRRPRPGEVLLFTGADGRPMAHRVVAYRRSRGQWYVSCLGDGRHGILDAPVRLDNALGRVTHYQRDGGDCPVARQAPSAVLRLRGLLALAEATGASVRGRWWVRAGRGLRRLWGRALAIPAGTRSWPVVGSLVRLVWPAMAGRCRIDVTDASTDTRRLFVLDALVRGRSVARTGLHQGFVLPQRAAEWWVSGAYTAPLYRRRGLGGVLLGRALQVAWEQGAPEVFAAIARGNHASQVLFGRAGFRPLEDPSIGEALDAHFRRRDPNTEPLIVFSVKAGGDDPPA